jgi:hypothetical protein
MDPFNDPRIGYMRPQVEQVPTRTGQYVINNSDLDGRLPPWLIPGSNASKPSMPYGKGFCGCVIQ